MKYLYRIAILIGFSFPALANDHQVIGEELFVIYDLQHSDKKLPIPALFIYDTHNEKYLTSQEVVNFVRISSETELSDATAAGLKYLAKEIPTAAIPKKAIQQATKEIDLNNQYIAFYHNMGTAMLNSFPDNPEIKESEETLIKILSKTKNANLYTLL